MRYLPQEAIRRKRDAGELEAAEISAFVRGIADDSISDAQVAAFAMAICLRGMSVAETVAITLAMRDSGRVLHWTDLPGPVVDKHSTGGVGDKVSLILAPILAACGCYVPMLSGRGLGHTGGTLDKLESIPGYRTRPDLETIRTTVKTAGCAIVGQTDDLAPADRRLYAIRDVTATVESVPLITASILSKKLAVGSSALVMDVKVGSGAFLPGLDDARTLARSIVDVANGAGLACSALLTDMDQCLGRTAGNAVETEEAIGVLRGEGGDERLLDVTLALCAEVLVLAGVAADMNDGMTKVRGALAGGEAAEHFQKMVAALGGPHDLLDRPRAHLGRAPVEIPVPAPTSGFVSRIDVRALGLAIIGLGGGRTRVDDLIDHRVGLTAVAGLGEPVLAGAPLAMVHAADRAAAEQAVVDVTRAFAIGSTAPQVPSAIRERIAVAASGQPCPPDVASP
ncbi:MAG: thymidine phosphorylase [Geminicoccaceae bacterium]